MATVSEIDALLQEIDNANVEVKASPARSSSQGGAAATAATPRRTSAANFSTYVMPSPQEQQDASPTQKQHYSPQPRLPGGRKLAPLDASAVHTAAPTVSVKAAFDMPLVGDGDKKKVRRNSLSQPQPSGAPESPSKRSDVSEEDHPNVVNFLPVMHARPMETHGIAPKARWGHTLTAVGDSLYLFGGTLTDGTVTADHFEFNVGHRSWEPTFHEAAEIPPARSQHTAVEFQNRYHVIFGGCTDRGTLLLNDVYAYDTVSLTWARLGQESYRHEPTGRYGHTAVVYGTKMYIFGGRCGRRNGGEGTQLTNDTQVFCLATNAWKKRIHISNTAEGKDDGKDEKEDAAEKEKDAVGGSKMVPPKRFNHAACLLGGTMYIHGGEGANGPLGDTWALDLTTKEWRLVHDGVDAVPRCRHFLFGCGEALLALGGMTTASATPAGSAVKEAPIAVLPVLEKDPNTGATSLAVGQSWMAVTLANGSGGVANTRRSFGCAAHCGFLYLFGGNTATEPANNTMVRCLTMDGVPIATTTFSLLQAQMGRLLDDRHFIDLYMVVEGERIGAHRLLLQSRVPKFCEEVLRCRNETAGVEGRLPEYSMVSSSRVQGMSVPFTAPILRLFLQFIYCASLPAVDDITSAQLALLNDIAVKYEVTTLLTYLTAPSSSSPDRRVPASSPSKSRGAHSKASAIRQAKTELSSVLHTLLEQGTGATATVLFTDPHTQTQTAQPVHPFLLAGASTMFRQLLKPLCVDGKTSLTVNGITGKKAVGGSSRRGVVIGPVSIPTPSIRHVLRFLYTCELDVPAEAALATMMGANSLGLAALQAQCESIVAREEVTYDTACSYLTLAVNHHAPLLEELSLLTASLGYEDTVRNSPGFTGLPQAMQQSIQLISQELQGRWVPPPAPPATEQKDPEYYRMRLRTTM